MLCIGESDGKQAVNSNEKVQHKCAYGAWHMETANYFLSLR